MAPVADELDRMSDEALAALEDQLLLDAELNGSAKAQFSLARGMIFVLTFVTFMIYLQVYARVLPHDKLGPLNIPLYLLTLGLAVATVHVGWTHLPRPGRQGIRWALDHWPMVFYLGAMLLRAAE